jgi:hypothetical protein
MSRDFRLCGKIQYAYGLRDFSREIYQRASRPTRIEARNVKAVAAPFSGGPSKQKQAKPAPGSFQTGGER